MVQLLLDCSMYRHLPHLVHLFLIHRIRRTSPPCTGSDSITSKSLSNSVYGIPWIIICVFWSGYGIVFEHRHIRRLSFSGCYPLGSFILPVMGIVFVYLIRGCPIEQATTRMSSLLDTTSRSTAP
ncbi:hypothetical protein DFS33DRAFT_1298589 [Desarmillaria ectypa]|nr:hypothetical protein DFS33DRAFT_1298589 [Desarmillaria ectypa]